MKRKAKKFFSIFIIAIILILSFSSCGGVKFTIHDRRLIREGVTFTDEFIMESKVKDAIFAKMALTVIDEPYYKEEYGVEKEENQDKPTERLYVVKTQQEFNEIFKEFPRVNFEKEMIIVYCFATHFADVKLSRIIKNDGVLRIVLKDNGRGGIDSHTRYVIIKMKKAEFKDIEFIVKK